VTSLRWIETDRSESRIPIESLRSSAWRIRLRLVTVARWMLSMQPDLYASAVDQITGPSPEKRPIDPRQPVIAHRRRGN
jgi:hypothetical protein